MSWTCDDARARLDEWIEGALSDLERRALDAHLEACPACRAEACGLERLRAAAAGLPREIRPPRDLWPAIDARLDEAEALADEEIARKEVAAVGSGLPGWVLAAAALALVVVTAVVTATLTRQGGDLAADDLAGREARLLVASQELLVGLEGGDLSPETMAIVRRNLAVIDAAIDELRVALEKDPGNGDLTRMLLATYQRKIELLEQAARAGEEG